MHGLLQLSKLIHKIITDVQRNCLFPFLKNSKWQGTHVIYHLVNGESLSIISHNFIHYLQKEWSKYSSFKYLFFNSFKKKYKWLRRAFRSYPPDLRQMKAYG